MNSPNIVGMKIILYLYLFILTAYISHAQSPDADFRDRTEGLPIFQNGYVDQPYVVVMDDGGWLCVFTTNAGREGSGGQHIVSTVSRDQGRTWSSPVRIEEPTPESASWAMPFKTKYGRVYVFYSYNGEKIHTLNEKTNIREDVLGWYCFKFTDDQGKTWSKRHRLPVRLTDADLNNDWNGKVQIFWGIGKPIDLGRRGMMFAFTKLGRYMLEDGEGWFIRCDNIHRERDPEKLRWINLPEGQHGLRNPDFGSIQEEQNIVELSNGSLYCIYRTTMGHPAESYSTDGGRSWSLPQIPAYYTGQLIKHPRACIRIFKTSTGRYLLWQHVNGASDFIHRNPVWISGGIEENGRIKWTQPEILLYGPHPLKDAMSYPDLIEQDGRYWVTETNKVQALSHEIPAAFLESLWRQFNLKELATEGLVLKESGDNLMNRTFNLSKDEQPSKGVGFTIDLEMELTGLGEGKVIFSSREKDGRGYWLEMASNRAVTFTMTDGVKTTTWSSDAGLIRFAGTTQLTLIVDYRARIISYVINGMFNDGGKERIFGWGRLDTAMGSISTRTLTLGDIRNGGVLRPANKISSFLYYDRPLMVTEAVGNHRARSIRSRD